VRDATHVLDGLLYRESELQIEEHYTDTAGFTNHVFTLCHLLGFHFAPRIRHVGETRLFSVEKSSRYPTLERLIGGAISTKQITTHWDEALRLAASIHMVPSPPRSCCASLVRNHVRMHSLLPYGKSGNWNARCSCWSTSRTSNYESAFMLA
jgi:TnpA family transposase